MKSLDVTDLIGRPWREANCAAIVAEVHRRLGFAACPWVDEWTCAASDAPRGSIEEILQRARSEWSPASVPLRIGDVILSDSGPGASYPLHVGVVVGLPNRILTSFPRFGACIVPLRTVARMRGAWRRAQ